MNNKCLPKVNGASVALLFAYKPACVRHFRFFLFFKLCTKSCEMYRSRMIEIIYITDDNSTGYVEGMGNSDDDEYECNGNGCKCITRHRAGVLVIFSASFVHLKVQYKKYVDRVKIVWRLHTYLLGIVETRKKECSFNSYPIITHPKKVIVTAQKTRGTYLNLKKVSNWAYNIYGRFVKHWGRHTMNRTIIQFELGF